MFLRVLFGLCVPFWYFFMYALRFATLNKSLRFIALPSTNLRRNKINSFLIYIRFKRTSSLHRLASFKVLFVNNREKKQTALDTTSRSAMCSKKQFFVKNSRSCLSLWFFYFDVPSYYENPKNSYHKKKKEKNSMTQK